MRYSLRTPMVLLALGPPLLAAAWFVPAMAVALVGSLVAATVLGLSAALVLWIFGF